MTTYPLMTTYDLYNRYEQLTIITLKIRLLIISSFYHYQHSFQVHLAELNTYLVCIFKCQLEIRVWVCVSVTHCITITIMKYSPDYVLAHYLALDCYHITRQVESDKSVIRWVSRDRSSRKGWASEYASCWQDLFARLGILARLVMSV